MACVAAALCFLVVLPLVEHIIPSRQPTVERHTIGPLRRNLIVRVLQQSQPTLLLPACLLGGSKRLAVPNQTAHAAVYSGGVLWQALTTFQ